MHEIYQVIEYYQAFFNSEDVHLVDDCLPTDARCAEYLRDKSYLSDEDYQDYVNPIFYLCSDANNYCYEGN